MVAVTLCFGVLVLYLPALWTQIAPHGDSGELVTVAYTLGIAHPPGYPLYTLLAHFFTRLPFGSIAARVNFFSLVCHLLTLFFLFLTVKKVTHSFLAAAATITVLAFSATFWLYSLIAEVFPLNDLIISLALFVSVHLSQTSSRRQITTFALLLTFIIALGFSNHHTIVLLVPPLLFFLWPQIKIAVGNTPPAKRLVVAFALVLAFLAGLSPYLYILVRAREVIPVAWSYPQTISDLAKIFARSDYGTFSPYSGADPALTLLGQKADQLVNYARFLLDDFSPPGILLSVLGAILGLRFFRRFTLFLLFSFSLGLFFLTYASFPFKEPSGTTLLVLERFYLFPNVFIALLIGLSVGISSRLLKNRPLFSFLPTLIAVLVTITLIPANFPTVSPRNNSSISDFARNILALTPPNSILIPNGDVATFTTFYLHFVENVRADVSILTQNQANPGNRYRYLKTLRPDLDYTYPEVGSLSGFMRRNYLAVPFVTFGASADPPGLVSSPSGIVYRYLRPEEAQSFEKWQKENEESLQKMTFPQEAEISSSPNLADRVVFGFYAAMYQSLGNYCAQFQQWSCAREYYRRALTFDQTYTLPRLQLAFALEKSGQCNEAEKEYLRVMEINPRARFVFASLDNLAKTCPFPDEKKKFYHEEYLRLQEIEKPSLKSL